MNGTISFFICLECGELIEAGDCGKHRTKTGHKNYRSIYKAHPGEKNV